MAHIVNELELPLSTGTLLLSQTEAMAVFDCLLENKNATAIKHELHLESSKIKALIPKLIELRVLVEALVKGTKIQTAEEFHHDEETGEKVIDIAEALYPAQTAKAGLKITVMQHLLSTYDPNDGLFNVTSMSELQTGIEYVIDKFILHSNIANNATFEWYKTQLNR